MWFPALKEAGLAPRAPYQTRHTAASLWLASGENPEWIARQLGHANKEMLCWKYSKFIPNLTRRDGSAFQQFLDVRLERQRGSKKTRTQEHKNDHIYKRKPSDHVVRHGRHRGHTPHDQTAVSPGLGGGTLARIWFNKGVMKPR